MSAWESQLRKGLVELAVLALVARGETYGYRVVEQLGEIAGLALTESTVYPVLTRLARDGTLSVRQEASPAGPMRRYYCLTTEGEVRLRQMVASWKTVLCSVNAVLEGVL